MPQIKEGGQTNTVAKQNKAEKKNKNKNKNKTKTKTKTKNPHITDSQNTTHSDQTKYNNSREKKSLINTNYYTDKLTHKPQ